MITADLISCTQARVLGPQISSKAHQPPTTNTPSPSSQAADSLRLVFPITAPISWSCLLKTKLGCPCRERTLEKRRQEGSMHRSHSKTIFFPDLNLRPCLDSSASRLRSEAISRHSPHSMGKERKVLPGLLQYKYSGLCGQASSQGKGC